MTLHTCWKLNVYFVLSWMSAREGSSLDEVTNEFGIQLTAHCRDLFLLCCLAALKEKTAVFLQCTSVLHRRTVWFLKGVYGMTWNESHMVTVLIMAAYWPTLFSWANISKTYSPYWDRENVSSSTCRLCTFFQCFCISIWLCTCNANCQSQQLVLFPVLLSSLMGLGNKSRKNLPTPSTNIANNCEYFLLKIETQLVWRFLLVDKENKNCFVHLISPPPSN